MYFPKHLERSRNNLEKPLEVVLGTGLRQTCSFGFSCGDLKCPSKLYAFHPTDLRLFGVLAELLSPLAWLSGRCEMPGPGISSFSHGEDRVRCGEFVCSPHRVSGLAALAEPYKQMSSLPQNSLLKVAGRTKSVSFVPHALENAFPLSSHQKSSIPDKLSICLCLSPGFWCQPHLWP